MHIEGFFVPGLAHASYLIASGNEAAVVDPERNVGGYIAYLARNRLKLKAIILTHPHAGSVNIGIASPAFPVWCGFFVSPDRPIALVVESETEAQQAQLELIRIGFDQVAGFISADDLDETLQITQIGARDFLASLEGPQRPLILDVRAAQEWNHDHLEGAIHVPLPQLLRRIGGISRSAPLTVVCASGYRSSIAASLLESQGFERLANVMGGMYAVRHAKRPRLPIMELAESAITWEI